MGNSEHVSAKAGFRSLPWDPGSWRLVQRQGSASELHAPWPPAHLRSRRIAALCRVTGAAVVLGSTQDTLVRQPLGPKGVPGSGRVEVVRRKSGGGAVLVAPGSQLWVDLWVPRGDPLWSDDVVAAAHWVGELFESALGLLGVGGASVHRAPLVRNDWSHLACFGALGPGEVAVHGRKAVGVAQRRDRFGAWFHCMAHARWDPGRLLSLLDLDHAERQRGQAALVEAAVGLVDLTGRDDRGSVELAEAAVEALLA